MSNFKITGTKNKTVDPAASNNDTLIGSVMPVYPIHIDYEKERWKHTPLLESNAHGERLWFNAADTETKFWAGMEWPDDQ